jgi:transcriptional antiterminator RfaH
MSARWYALHSNPRKEEALQRHVLARGFEAYWPSLRVRPANPRSRTTRPFFPGYLFVRIDLETTGEKAFRRMPYATGLVGFGGTPASIPDALVAGVRRRVQELGADGGTSAGGLRPRDPVVVTGGLFAGHEGIFDTRLSGGERVRILLRLLGGRALALELDRDCVSPQPSA